ncbi:hypothetical protein Ngar_c16540 [Candidatus Nitrososphaera gargensis Ga9.2]|uniref:Uncharacterized protein n=1 Tax=Nitrososphaera gargensis (strain Ga9.2) TaxID=1237085 RepID=K0IJY6_NITGG|nr:hypothetical protein Ngar_c16540 [Candidatus Nitrososphaera gargensis Ga9.2]
MIVFHAKNTVSLSGKIVHKAYSFIGSQSHIQRAAPVQQTAIPKPVLGCANKPFYYSKSI